ncbi:APC family permease [Modestobacter sp. Leaf380]|uniref:APC family permease n=1 Tax=Modestobacter sp. Leaf380 TaxID=1736356 RepID=UPI0006F2D187|nr:APC family permease [Modestobacter sp. Leaf380]KQS65710.1 amino acid permease [Modestobacter sp. Leaf380]
MAADITGSPGAGASTERSEGRQTLKGNMGVGELVMSVLAFSAPLTTVAGFIPVLLLFSSTTGPAIYLLATVLLVLFSIGFIQMGRRVENPGGFYSFVTAGLGKSAGLGGAFLATFGYAATGFFAPALFAVTLQSYIVDLGGPTIPWYWLALAIVALVTALAYRRIDLSARVLTVVMLLEVIVVIIFNVASFASGNGADSGGAVLSLPWVTDPNIGLALLFVLSNFFGFEATVIYREEVKDPRRTIPRATMIAVSSIGVFYAVAAWAYIAFFGANDVQGAAEADTAGIFNSALTTMIGKTAVDIITVLFLTSIMASMLSIQNVASRYLYSLGTDGVLPAKLGRVHPRHGSPFVSASVIGILYAVLIAIFALAGTSPDLLYAKASGVGTFAVLLLLVATSIAVFVYFRRNGREDASVWSTVIAPLLAAVGLAVIAYLAIVNYSDLIGDTGALTTTFLVFTFALFIGGVVLARVLRTRRPDVYQRIGRESL